jgi:hypothetical protein
MNIVFYCNCQADGILHFLKKTPLAAGNHFSIWYNFRLILLEQDRNACFQALAAADLVIYQPTTALDCRDGFQVPDSNTLFDQCLRHGTPRISFSYQFNHGFFPILKVAPSFDGWITGEDVKQRVRRAGTWDDLSSEKPIFRDSGGQGHYCSFDCARRFIECLAEQSRREQTCDVQMVDWILANYQTQRLFLTQNHPASALFAELARRIYAHAVCMKGLYHNMPEIPFFGVNDAGLPGEMPVHPAVVRELGLKYGAIGDQRVFRTLLEQFVKDPDK